MANNRVVTSNRRSKKLWRVVNIDAKIRGFYELHMMIKDSGAGIGAYPCEIADGLSILDVNKEALRPWIEKESIVEEREERSVFNLALVTPAKLGFKSSKVSRGEFYNSAIKRGMGLCSATLGMQLRAQYVDQPEGEIVFVATEPIVAPAGKLMRMANNEPPYIVEIILEITNHGFREIGGVLDICYVDRNSSWVFTV